MNPYPVTAEAVDGHLSESIKTLTQTTRDGFNDVKAQMRDMATKDAVNAEVKRLDLRVDHVDDKITTGFAELKARDVERDKKNNQRITWILTVFGLLFTAFQIFIVPLFGG